MKYGKLHRILLLREPGNSAFPQGIKSLSQLACKCQQTLSALYSWNIMLFRSTVCEIQDNKEADALDREGSSSPVLGPKPAILISPCVDRLKVMEWLK
jgi:hypothetical protein